MRNLFAVLMVAILLGGFGITEAKLREDTEARQGLAAPKIPKLVDQTPEDPKLVARDDYYSPKYLEVDVAGGNEITVRNKGGKIHGFVIPAFGSQTILKPGEVKKIAVPEGKKAGVYDFFCPFHPHMRGTIEVVS